MRSVPSRRSVVVATAVGTATAALSLDAPSAHAKATRRRQGAAADRGPCFVHGVASGDPLPDGVLLWSRVTPSPEATPGSGKGEPVTVGWEIALDRHFDQVAAQGRIKASASGDHTVKADVRGLRPATDYWYRFHCGSATSPIGHTRTAPRHDAVPDAIRFGVVSCANWEGGWFSPYRHLADRYDLDAVLHLGDYIYESATYAGQGPIARLHHPLHECVSLGDYRARHGTYKTDPDLQALHSVTPVIAIWDDHEFADAAWAHGAENHQPETEGSWTDRAAAARRAYFEWMPVRPSIAGTTYRQLSFGSLAMLFLLDLRSFRNAPGGSAEDPLDVTITGRTQMDWLKNGLATSDAGWQLVGNSVMMSPVRLPDLPLPELRALSDSLGSASQLRPLNPDSWDGYTADRRELLQHLDSHHIGNTVFLTGDVHCAWAAHVPLEKKARTDSGVAVEFVVTSVSSDNFGDQLAPPRPSAARVEAAVVTPTRTSSGSTLPHTATPSSASSGRVQMDYFAVTDRMTPHAPSSLKPPTVYVPAAACGRVGSPVRPE
uniref:Alkaline phosphatase n=1 Tax=Streptomyces sp. NRRL 30471 TaxID=996287 RepID=F2WUE4_9ACTN|nr:alkaline phosphatase [Streptomyces sp. NRRL 30471]